LTDIVIISSDSVMYDPRTTKIAKSLNKRYSILILGWNREEISSEKIDSYTLDLNLFNLKAPYGKPSLLVYLPIFWTWILLKLLQFRPKVVHACDFDTLLPSYLYKIIFRKKIVFDVFDRYSGLIPLKNKMLYFLVNSVEEQIAKNADVLITVSEKVLNTFRNKPKHCAIIMNCSEDNAIEKGKKEDHMLKLVYAGAIRRNFGLERISAAIKDLDNVELVLAGRIRDKDLLDQLLELPNVKYKGLIPVSDALALEANSDVMVVLYNLEYRYNQLSSPNKIFEAMMLGLPVITNMEPRLVNEEVWCGIVVDYNNVDQIKAAVVSLRDNTELRRRLGMNGRKAFLQKYNWTNMEQSLYKIYDELLMR
jgi:glycosyltransferase involved in cell wall biosynthesis